MLRCESCKLNNLRSRRSIVQHSKQAVRVDDNYGCTMDGYIAVWQAGWRTDCLYRVKKYTQRDWLAWVVLCVFSCAIYIQGSIIHPQSSLVSSANQPTSQPATLSGIWCIASKQAGRQADKPSQYIQWWLKQSNGWMVEENPYTQKRNNTASKQANSSQQVVSSIVCDDEV